MLPAPSARTGIKIARGAPVVCPANAPVRSGILLTRPGALASVAERARAPVRGGQRAEPVPHSRSVEASESPPVRSPYGARLAGIPAHRAVRGAVSGARGPGRAGSG